MKRYHGQAARLRMALTALTILMPLRGVDAQLDTMTSAFNVNGLNVILRHNSANDVVAANVYLLGGAQQLTPATQGIERFLLAASERGTADYPGDVARQRIARLGTDINVVPSADWTLVGFTSIRSTFDSSFVVLADRLARPTLDSLQVELVRTRLIASAQEAEHDPDLLLNRLVDSLAFVGHPYGFSPLGTVSSFQSITLDALRHYQTSQMVSSRMLLVVVGNVQKDHLQALVARTLGGLPHGTYSWAPPRARAQLGRALVVRDEVLPTSYLLGYCDGPAAIDADYQALRVATAVLSGRLFTEVRSKRNLSYDVGAPFVSRAVASGGLYVTTTDPNQTLQVMSSELARLKRELIEPQGLQRLIGQFITDYFLKNETNGDQATFLARAQIYHGDYRAADRFVANLRRVTPEDVRRVARQYMHDFRFVYLGRSDRLSRALFAQF